MPTEDAALNAQVQTIWEANAAFWDEIPGPEGNLFHRTLIAPATLRLLALQPGERVLEIACGNGQFAREMARLGVEVVAFDFAPTFIERARAYSAESNLPITYHVMDATDEAQMLGLGVGQFDAAVANMALMDISDLSPALRAVSRLLKLGGRLVFSVTHPCFNQSGQHLFLEREDRDGQLITVAGVKVSSYLTTSAQRGIGIIGQPQPHYYFNRTLSQIINACADVGLPITGMAEPAFPAGSPANHAFSWSNFPEIPPALIVRCARVSEAAGRVALR